MPYDRDNVFARILRDEIPSTRVYEDDEFIAFKDIQPAAPTHVLVVPRQREMVGIQDVTEADAGWLGRMMVVASSIARDLGLAEGGYRLVINNGADAGQAVPHLHMHILGGKQLSEFA
jgi:histidine triad (HIT) family protein